MGRTTSQLTAMLASVLATAALLGGCGHGGSKTPATSGVPATLRITSSVLHDGQPITPPYGCLREGDAGTSPPLSWPAGPAGTVVYAITIIDTDAHNFLHWGVLNLRARSVQTGQRSYPAGVRLLRNGFGHRGYGAPCPPPGKMHHYVVTVWALKRRVTDLASLSGAAAARGTITVTYQR